MQRILVTGGAGFIGSEVVRQALQLPHCAVINVDKLTYAGNLERLTLESRSPNYMFIQADISDAAAMREVFAHYKPSSVIHLAAESHVDRSIDGSATFVQTNIVGTHVLLEAARTYWQSLPVAQQLAFRFLHVSTDEVFGSLGESGLFTETTAYQPNSPYSASKASSDFLVRSWHQTYGLPTIITHCSNNYGPYQFPEKLIPLITIQALHGKALPVYGKGLNVRDWLYVSDHVDALLHVLQKGKVGETYNIGGNCEKRNIEIVFEVCEILDSLIPHSSHRPHSSLIRFVTDRPGHDFRYAIDCSKIQRELGWKAKESLSSGLRKTLEWYLQNESWWQNVRMVYDGARLGLTPQHSLSAAHS